MRSGRWSPPAKMSSSPAEPARERRNAFCCRLPLPLSRNLSGGETNHRSRPRGTGGTTRHLQAAATADIVRALRSGATKILSNGPLRCVRLSCIRSMRLPRTSSSDCALASMAGMRARGSMLVAVATGSILDGTPVAPRCRANGRRTRKASCARSFALSSKTPTQYGPS